MIRVNVWTGLACVCSLLGCASTHRSTNHEDWDSVAAELIEMAERDQSLERLVIDGDPQVRDAGFFEMKEKVQREHGARCSEILREHGFPDWEVVGREASSSFWVLVQHSDHDVGLQERVCLAMESAVADGRASAQEFAYLVDRVRVNTGRTQIYGTQTAADPSSGRVYPKELEDGPGADVLRMRIGLDPLWVYYNEMCELHFRMNEAVFRDRGIGQPYRYAEGFTDW